MLTRTSILNTTLVLCEQKDIPLRLYLLVFAATGNVSPNVVTYNHSGIKLQIKEEKQFTKFVLIGKKYGIS